jgi:hypothetical protein
VNGSEDYCGSNARSVASIITGFLEASRCRWRDQAWINRPQRVFMIFRSDLGERCRFRVATTAPQRETSYKMTGLESRATLLTVLVASGSMGGYEHEWNNESTGAFRE